METFCLKNKKVALVDRGGVGCLLWVCWKYILGIWGVFLGGMLVYIVGISDYATVKLEVCWLYVAGTLEVF